MTDKLKNEVVKKLLGCDTVLIMRHYVDGIMLKDIAKERNVSFGSIRVKLCRINGKVKSLINFSNTHKKDIAYIMNEIVDTPLIGLKEIKAMRSVKPRKLEYGNLGMNFYNIN